jgi:hypothetical protein
MNVILVSINNCSDRSYYVKYVAVLSFYLDLYVFAYRNI